MSNWDGKERRNEGQRFCEGHLKLCEDMAIVKTTVLALDKRINGTVDDMKTHMGNSRGRNLAIGGSILTIALYLFNLASEMGANKKQIEVNTAILNRVNTLDRK